MPQYRPPLVRVSLPFAFLLVAGCGDGTFPELSGANPYLRHQWAEDRRFGPTFDQQLEELAQLESTAKRMSAEEQLRWSQQLVEILQESRSPLLRARSARALAAFATAPAAAGLQMAMIDKDVSVRIAACQGWGRRGGPEALAALTQLVQQDSHVDVRMAATRELAKFKDPRAVQALGVALNDRDPALQWRAVESLRQASGRNFGADISAWRQFVQGGNPPEQDRSIAQQFREIF